MSDQGPNTTDIARDKFLSIKIKQTTYLGSQAIVVQVSDSTEKIRQKIYQLQRKEEHQNTK